MYIGLCSPLKTLKTELRRHQSKRQKDREEVMAEPKGKENFGSWNAEVQGVTDVAEPSKAGI